MTAENKALIRRFCEVVNTRNMAAVEDFVEGSFATNYVAYENSKPGTSVSHRGIKQYLKRFYAVMPDLSITVEDLIAEGDKVVIRWTMRGTHTGEFMGSPPTGNPLTVKAMECFRIAGGRIVERWSLWDQLTLLQQLGAVPPAGRDEN
jgi:steroid delta-isomerase-like uncharacterized protein